MMPVGGEVPSHGTDMGVPTAHVVLPGGKNDPWDELLVRRSIPLQNRQFNHAPNRQLGRSVDRLLNHHRAELNHLLNRSLNRSWTTPRLSTRPKKWMRKRLGKRLSISPVWLS